MLSLHPKSALRIVSFITLFALVSCAEKEEEEVPLAAEEFTVVSTLAGSESAGFVDGIGSMARFNHPAAMVIDAEGNIYVSDQDNHSIRKITPAGVVSTFAGTGKAGFDNGMRVTASFRHPYGLAIDRKGNMYVGDVGNHCIRKIAPDGKVSTLAGGRKGFSDRKGDLAMFNHPYGVAVDSKNNVYVADSYNNRIRKIKPDGSTSTLAGNGRDGFIDGRALRAEFYVPIGIVIDEAGNVYVGDEGNSSIRKVTTDGFVTTLAGNGKFSFGDGVGRGATFNAPGGIALDKHGNLYVADYLNNAIRRVSVSGQVHTIAGSADKGFADGHPSQAKFHYPFGIAVDAAGLVYVGDQYNHRIRKID